MKGTEMWDRAMAGMLLFCIYARARWSDAQHAEQLLPDLDSNGEIVHMEVRNGCAQNGKGIPFASHVPAIVGASSWGHQRCMGSSVDGSPKNFVH